MDAAGGNESAYYYHVNSNSSVVAISNAVGELVERYAYSAYGSRTIISAASGGVLSASIVSNVIAFTGRWVDDETSLLYYRARYYDSSHGRFVSRDPLFHMGFDPNAYAYVHGNPFAAVDPSGKAAVVVIPIAGGAVVLSAAEAAAAAFGLSVWACLGHPECAAAMAKAVEEALEGLSELAIELLKTACDIKYQIYKATEKLCGSCSPYRGKCFVERVERCASASANAACWSAVAAGRAAYILSGCDALSDTPNLDGHINEAMGKFKAYKHCVTEAKKNCVNPW